jgi:hypothetical protein
MGLSKHLERLLLAAARMGYACRADDPDGGNHIKSAIKKGYLSVCPRSFGKGRSLYRLTPLGCRMIGAPRSRSRPLGGQALNYRVTVGEFLRRFPRYQFIALAQMKDAFDDTIPQRMYAKVCKRICLFYVCEASNENAVKHTEADLSKLASLGLSHFQVVVLVESRTKQRSLRRVLMEHGRRVRVLRFQI